MANSDYIPVSIPIAVNDIQKVGSTITYMRRYSLASLFGIIAEPDDDGETAQGRGQIEKQRAKGGIVTTQQASLLYNLAKDKKMDKSAMKVVLKEYGYTSFNDIKVSDFEKLKTAFGK